MGAAGGACVCVPDSPGVVRVRWIQSSVNCLAARSAILSGLDYKVFHSELIASRHLRVAGGAADPRRAPSSPPRGSRRGFLLPSAVAIFHGISRGRRRISCSYETVVSKRSSTRSVPVRASSHPPPSSLSSSRFLSFSLLLSSYILSVVVRRSFLSNRARPVVVSSPAESSKELKINGAPVAATGLQLSLRTILVVVSQSRPLLLVTRILVSRVTPLRKKPRRCRPRAILMPPPGVEC